MSRILLVEDSAAMRAYVRASLEADGEHEVVEALRDARNQMVEEALAPLCDRFLNGSLRYWQRWVKHCNIPPAFQQESLRVSIARRVGGPLRIRVVDDVRRRVRADGVQ